MSEKDNIISMAAYREKEDEVERLDPNELHDAEFISAILSRMTHPSLGRDSHRFAHFVTDEIAGSNEEIDEWQRRFRELTISVGDMDEESFKQIKEDEVIIALQTIVRSKNGRAEVNKDILNAARVLIDFRARSIMNIRDREMSADAAHWVRVVENLTYGS